MAFFVSSNTDPTERKVRTGSKSVVKRNKKGETEVERKKTDSYVGEETLAEDRKYMAGKGSGQYAGGGAAPRTGGAVKATQGGVPKGGTKKQVKAGKKQIKRSAASPQAKKAALMVYRKRS